MAHGTPVEALVLSNNRGISATIITFGATPQALTLPKPDGRRVQFYSANLLDATTTGKSAELDQMGNAIVLEPQAFPTRSPVRFSAASGLSRGRPIATA